MLGGRCTAHAGEGPCRTRLTPPVSPLPACTGAAWSQDERYCAYVAEAAPPARTPEWGALPAGGDGKKGEGAAAKGWRGQGEWSEDWGELNTGEGEGWGEASKVRCRCWDAVVARGRSPL